MVEEKIRCPMCNHILYKKQEGLVCKNWRCVEDDSWLGHCGDGKCESVLGETATSCPEDCGDWDPKDEFNFNWLYLIPILLTLGVAGMFGWNGKSKTGNYYWLDFVIGGFLGLMVGLVLYWIFSNWLVLLLIGMLGSAGMIGLILIVGGIPLLLFSYGGSSLISTMALMGLLMNISMRRFMFSK